MLNGPKVRVVFVRDKSKPDRWLAIACTDLTLTPNRVCRIYAKRWAIEVFFKQIMQELGLASEGEVRSYAALVAHTSVMSTLNLSGLKNESLAMKSKFKKPDRFYPTFYR